MLYMYIYIVHVCMYIYIYIFMVHVLYLYIDTYVYIYIFIYIERCLFVCVCCNMARIHLNSGFKYCVLNKYPLEYRFVSNTLSTSGWQYIRAIQVTSTNSLNELIIE